MEDNRRICFPFLDLRKVKGVHLSDTQNLQLRSELEPVPLVSGLVNPSIEWYELTAPFNKPPPMLEELGWC